MLPTNKAEGIMFFDTITVGKLITNLNTTNITWTDCKYQHLYIISDEEIKEGDWVIMNNKWIVQLYEIENGYAGIRNDVGSTHISNCKKIIATTDNICTNTQEEHYTRNWLPQIPESFVNVFVDSYNKNEVINKVDLETEISSEWLKENPPFSKNHTKPYYSIKVRTDNTVIIHPSEENQLEIKLFKVQRDLKAATSLIDQLSEYITYLYTKEDIVNLISKFNIELAAEVNNFVRDKWIKENVK